MSSPNGHDTREAAGTVTIAAETVETLIHAAGCWRRELQEYIIPASQQFEDSESAQSQQDDAEAIAEAIATAYQAKQLNEDVKD